MQVYMCISCFVSLKLFCTKTLTRHLPSIHRQWTGCHARPHRSMAYYGIKVTGYASAADRGGFWGGWGA